MNDKAINPFLYTWKLRVIKIKHSRNMVDAKHVNENEGIITEFTKEDVNYMIEEQKKASLYRLPYIDNVMFTELDGNGRSLLLYIAYHIQRNQDYINLHTERTCKAMGISRPTLIKAIGQLIDIGVVSKRKKQSEYWVNPQFIFNGNRIKFIEVVKSDCLEVVANQSLIEIPDL